MSTTDCVNIEQCKTTSLESVRYFPRQLITADDMRQEQDYFREKMRRHNRFLHGWGVVCGCQVEAVKDAHHRWLVRVHGGYVVTPRGDEILIPECIANKSVTFDLAGDWRQGYDPCPEPTTCSPASGTTADTKKTVHLAVCYTECEVRPVRIHPAGCGCDETACEYSRIRESFELVRLDELPTSHEQAEIMDKNLPLWNRTKKEKAEPLPGCPDFSGGDCVVLASITLPARRTVHITQEDISYDNRRVLVRS